LFKQIYDLTPRDLQRKVNQLAAQQGWRPKAVFATRFEPGDLELPKNEKIAGLYAMPKYLLNRGVTADIADYFDLRWCEQGTFTTLAPDGKQIKQDYSGRILLPIYDLHGEMVSFQGRDATGTSEKRYLFPSGFASTGEHLYNINNWADGQDTVTISEGVFDVIAVKKALSHARMDNVLPLGSFGMQFSIRPDSKDQISKLLLLKAKGLKNVVMLWDNEPAAMRNAIKTADQIRRYGFNVSVAKLSVSKDPGEASEGEIVTAINEAHAVRSNIDILMLERKLAHD
jgi:DNA primase